MRKLSPEALIELRRQFDLVRQLWSDRLKSVPFDARASVFGTLTNELNRRREDAGQSYIPTKIRDKQDWDQLLHEVELFLERQRHL